MKTVHELRKAGFTVKVRHIRKQRIVQKMDSVAWQNTPKGGSTEVAIYSDDIRLAHGQAVCSHRDNYCKKLGVRIALGRALKEVELS